jgi:ankyrin repeat protein
LLNKDAKVTDTRSTYNKKFICRDTVLVLHIAAAHDDKKIIEVLIDKVVDQDICRDVSLTQLHIAAFFGSSEAIKKSPGEFRITYLFTGKS